ncbi:MAG: hypothetical protein AAGJ35_13280, partial [Myxococcota bacterium]
MDLHQFNDCAQPKQTYVKAMCTTFLQIVKPMIQILPKSFYSQHEMWMALVVLVYMTVQKAAEPEGDEKNDVKDDDAPPRVSIFFLFQQLEVSPVVYIKVADDASPFMNIPTSLHTKLEDCETDILESCIWDYKYERTHSLIKMIAFLRANQHWPPLILAPTMQEELRDGDVQTTPERKAAPPPRQVLSQKPATQQQLQHWEQKADFVTYIIRQFLNLAFKRLSQMCSVLGLEWPGGPLATHAMLAFRFMLRNQIHLMYNRHLDPILICAMYGVSRSLLPKLTMTELIQAYAKLPTTSQGTNAETDNPHASTNLIMKQVHLKFGTTGDHGVVGLSGGVSQKGSVVELYNKIYIPAMKEHLIGSVSLHEAAAKCAAAAVEVTTARTTT